MQYGHQTFAEWRTDHPERWARIEGNLSHQELRTLKFLDAQVHLTRHFETQARLPHTPEVNWLLTCIGIYASVLHMGTYPTDSVSASWVKNQRRGALCDYQVAAIMRLPGWKWAPRRMTCDERAKALDHFRNDYGRDPRIRSGWEYERALAHWHTRQRRALDQGKLTPAQVAALDGDMTVPTLQVMTSTSGLAGTYTPWFNSFWDETVPLISRLEINRSGVSAAIEEPIKRSASADPGEYR